MSGNMFGMVGSNGKDPHGMARYGTEWRRIEPVDGSLTVPFDADEFVMVAGGGGSDFTTAEADRLRQGGAGGFVRREDGTETLYIGGFGGIPAGGGGGTTP